jgi:hypothetical protein
MTKVPLEDPNIPLIERCKLFNRVLKEQGAVDVQLLSKFMEVSPQVVTAFYELNTVEESEVLMLDKKRLDSGILSVLMNISPKNRPAVYENLDQFLKSDNPVQQIIGFLNGGSGRPTIRHLYDQVDKKFWPQVARNLRARDLQAGTINPAFRAVLVRISIKRASDPELQWLERALRKDLDSKLMVFTAPSLKEKFPDAVQAIEKFLGPDGSVIA